MSPVRYSVEVEYHNRMSHRRLMEEPKRRALERIGPIVLPEIQRRSPSGMPGTSNFVRLVRYELDRIAARWVLFYNRATYAAAVEFGRRPGGRMPPRAALLPWMRRAGIPPSAYFPVARAIAVRGIPGRFPFRDGIRAALPRIRIVYQRQFMDDVRQWRRRRY